MISVLAALALLVPAPDPQDGPCVARYPLVQRGVEVAAEGRPTILVWLVNGEPHVARLPDADRRDRQ